MTPFKTKGEDAAMILTFYKDTTASIITDIRNIKRLVGCVQSQGKWGIIDQSTNLVRRTFVVDKHQSEDDEVSSSDD
jgi:hypothetical protein